jgi:uncharacterized membrane protein
MMPTHDILQSLFRWIHIVAGILWIGLLYFFNWVNGPFAATLDGETKKKVVPELMPRSLFWFRWGAAWTWLTGVLLLFVVFYFGGTLFQNPDLAWRTGGIVMVLFTFLGVFIYDGLMKTLGLKNIQAAVVVGFILLCADIYIMETWAGFSYRGYMIHTGALFGTIMAFNVWFRIWPAQKKIITSAKNGEKPDPDLVALAGLRSRHNTYLSVPLVWTMINLHNAWAYQSWLYLPAAIILGWIVVYLLYKKAGKIKGF